MIEKIPEFEPDKITFLPKDRVDREEHGFQHNQENEKWREKSAKKRFLYPEKEIAQKRLRELVKSFEEYNTNDPDIVGITLFGSYARGKANELSDIDGTIFVKNTTREVKESVRSSFTTAFFKEINYHQDSADIKGSALIGKISRDLKISKEHFLDGLQILPVNNQLIDLAIRDSGVDINSVNYLSRMFNLSIGRGLDKYRNHFLLQVKNLPIEKAGDLWNKILKSLKFFESGKNFISHSPYNPPDQRGYPQNFPEAYKRYWKNMTESKDSE